MLIGIDASRAFIKNRTGIEEYSYQVIKHLRNKLNGHQVVVYIRKNQEINFALPENWKVKVIRWPRLWTQIGLSLETFFHPVDILFIPAHTVSIIHPKNTVVVIHGLEYEFCSEAYSWWEKFYMRRVIKNSCRWASKIISVSRNTKKDLMKLYNVPEEKIRVIYEGVSLSPFRKGRVREGFEKRGVKESVQNNDNFQIPPNPPFPKGGKFLLFIGRLEKRKNITGIIKAFEILKERYNIPHKLVLAGRRGYGYESIKYQISSIKYKDDIIETGYISEEDKWELLKNADVFLFPSFYEGFGLPILEAQSVGVPVVAGDNSSIPEISMKYEISTKYELYETTNKEGKLKEKSSVVLVDPHNSEEIAEAAYKLISDDGLKKDIIEKGYKNVKRFSWEKCADSIAKLLVS